MREAGVLMPIASLPSDYGIGELGKYSYEFIDLLKKSKIKLWQILPLNPLGFGNSPYQPYSSFAGDEIYISLEQLYKEGLLKEKPPFFQKESTKIDYWEVRKKKEIYLKEAFSNFIPEKEYQEFASQDWVRLYAVFLTFKKKNDLKCWNEWKKEHKDWIKDHKFNEAIYQKEIDYEMFLQYIFYKQWMGIKDYANRQGIKIMGDIPFYVGIDSLDVWANQENFLLGADGKATFIAGVPPDYFSATGQRWGNPIYNWDYMKKTKFEFWINRFAYNSKLFDIIRVDHFRAFDTYWKIPASCPTAIEGEWLEAPGYELLDTVKEKLPNIEIVAEDLGDLRKEVLILRDYYQFKGMKVVQFTFDPMETNNDFKDRKNMIVYTGTHDNQTIKGWFDSQEEKVKTETEIELYSFGYEDSSISHQFVRFAFDNIADIAIVPLQDILELGDEARLNIPGTVGSPNWEWKLKDLKAFEKQTSFLAQAVEESKREFGTQTILPKKREPKRFLEKFLLKHYKKEISESTKEEILTALLEMTKKLASENVQTVEKKKVYYISAEFLIGKLLSNNLINLGIYNEIKEFLKENGQTLSEIEEIELEPSLGNGGLGRLAACFLDSIATLGLSGDGIGLNYHFGLFEQKFKDLLQKEEKNPWITQKSWLIDTKKSYKVKFKDFTVKSNMYDIDIIGYENRTNKLHLFDIKTIDESIVTNGIDFDKEDIIKNLTLFLYPDDSDEKGRLLRIYQQYFMVSNAAQYILEECLQKGANLEHLEEYAVIQINDTHPTLIIPELIRLLWNRGIDIDKAIETVTKTCAYTNHTILAEALEKWPLSYLKKVVPHLVPIIEILDDKVRRKYTDESVVIIDRKDTVHMAHIDIHYGFSVNGVASLHTKILKENELNHFYKLYPEKFNNKTNGITFRRWLLHCNLSLTKLLEEQIGDSFKKDAAELKKLKKFEKDEKVLKTLLEIKHEKKKELKTYLEETQKITIDENSIFDIQIKRLHEYKRQQMNALYLIHKYLEIKKGILPKRPITAIFGAKAAPAYVIAKDIIHLILCLQELINQDKEVSSYLKVVMVENYNVTKAEKLIPACDISEQISLASKEASGTGNMKFMLNGAVTLGTMDGANVEIYDLVGEDNIYIFGEKSENVIAHYEKKDYISKDYYKKDKEIKEILDFIISKQMLSIGHKENLERLYNEILNKDWFMTLLDLKSYIKTKEQAFKDYEKRIEWAHKMLINISQAGYFSSDRTIEEYNKDIWKL